MNYAAGTRVIVTEDATVHTGTVQERYKLPNGMIYAYRVALDDGFLVHAFESDITQLVQPTES